MVPPQPAVPQEMPSDPHGAQAACLLISFRKSSPRSEAFVPEDGNVLAAL